MFIWKVGHELTLSQYCILILLTSCKYKLIIITKQIVNSVLYVGVCEVHHWVCHYIINVIDVFNLRIELNNKLLHTKKNFVLLYFIITIFILYACHRNLFYYY